MCHDSAHNAAGDGRRASASTISSAGRERFTGRHSRCEFTSRRPCAPRPSIVPPVLLLTATSCTAPDPSPFMQCWCRAIAGRQRRFVCEARVSYQYVWLLFGRCAVMVPDGSVHGGGQGSLQVERHPQPSPVLVATLIAGDGALLSATQPAAAPAQERCCAVSSVLCVPRFGNHLTASCAV